MRNARRLIVLTAALAVGVPGVVAAGSVVAPQERTAAAAPAQTAARAATGAPAAAVPAAPATSPAAAATSAAAPAATAPAPTPASPGRDVSSAQFDQRAADEALAFWTPERMGAAKPRPLPSRSGHEPSASPTAAEPMTAPATADLEAGSSVGALAAEAPRPYTSAPARTEVKIFFLEDGDEYVCSGTVVNRRSRRMVDTAGHCVSDGKGHYVSIIKVVPAYSSRCSGCEDEPYGAWTARTVTTRAEWHLHRNHKQDLGYIVTNDQNGRRIADVVGGVGTKFNISRDQHWAATGYPGEYPFNGYDQYVSESGRVADDDPDNLGQPGPLTIGIASSMTRGCSGGGWITGPYTNGIGYLNGHNSYGYVRGPLRNPNRMFGPYYGDEALALFNYTAELG